MSLKDYLRAINTCFFSHFPDLHQTTTVLLLQWNNQKSALKTVLETQALSCSNFSIKKILDSKRFELEKKGQISLEGLSSKTRSLVLKALNETSSSKTKNWKNNRGGSSRGRSYNHYDRSHRGGGHRGGSHRGGGGYGRGAYKRQHQQREKPEKDSNDSQT